MIKSLLTYQHPFRWFVFHLVLGVFSTYSPFFLIFYFYAFIFLSIPLLFKKHKSDSALSFIVVYLLSFEILARMAKTSPLVPYELGKYLLFSLLFIGMFSGMNKGKVGLFLVIVLIPALLYDFSNRVIFRDLLFNLLGPINIGVAIFFFHKQKFSQQGFQNLLYLLVLPLVSALSFTIFKTPDLNEIEFNLTANFTTTAGFGSNQVSTIFGLGMFLSFYLWLNKYSISGNRWIDLLLVIVFTFQGLLSFSRGGMIGGLLGIFVVLFFLTRSSNNPIHKIQLRKAKKYILPAIFFLVVSLFLANNVTDGNLLKRYQGETAGTLAGKKEKDLNSLTTNRYDIFRGDMQLIEEYGVLGVGAGASKYLRKEQNEVVSHVEVSRLIAEHGIFGFVYIIIILFLFFKVFKSTNELNYRSLLFAFILVGWYTTFHAATRTYITPLLMGLSMIYVRDEKNSLSRK